MKTSCSRCNNIPYPGVTLGGSVYWKGHRWWCKRRGKCPDVPPRMLKEESSNG